MDANIVAGAPATLAQRTLALYVGWSKHSVPASVVWRDQNAAHLMVFMHEHTSRLAR
ncbi:hypothetical protein [Bradyrhizobium sp. URHD0069]|jgi:hypothetical protein|uniref:hypothetical protein n=1 Tax=Bradyrhizobium sp. URHD0069 TaxID=1380355 RepID=UPI0018CC74F5|nr:hypothetical protein [Bradyrhizobium sp. URHD0069]